MYPADWKVGQPSDGSLAVGRLSCLVCGDGIWREYRNCSRHEHSQKHKSLVNFFEQESTLIPPEMVISGGTRPGERHFAFNRQSLVLGPLSYAFYKTQMGHLPFGFAMAEAGKDDRGSDKAIDDDSEQGPINLDYSLEETVDSIIIARTTSNLDEWLNRGLDIDSDSYLVDLINEEPQPPDFDYALGDLDIQLYFNGFATISYRYCITLFAAFQASGRRNLDMVSLAKQNGMSLI